MSPDLQVLSRQFARGVYNISTHGFQEMESDGITISILEASLGQDAPEIIEEYPNHYLGPCCLILAWAPNGEPLHAV